MIDVCIHNRSRVRFVLEALEKVNGCKSTSEDSWIRIETPDTLLQMSWMLKGIEYYQHVHEDKDTVQIALTLPEQPSQLAKALPQLGPYYTKMGATDSVFLKIAREAMSRLVIVTPFLDKVGIQWVLDLFEASPSDTLDRILIVRNYSSVEPLLVASRDQLSRLKVKILDYYLQHDDRKHPFETFHAKLVLGDDCQAYVGSANMLESSLEIALEVGVLLKGKSVLDIRRIVDSMIAVSHKAY